MYKTIYVPLDNSDHSNVSAELGLSVAKELGATLVGSHAYAAALHDVRFKQMEFTLPDEYKEEQELEKQRRIHDSLITRGLTLISDSYLIKLQKRAIEDEVPFEGKRFDGRNFEVIVEDIESSDYGLVILGALGQGAVRDSQVGSVCERVLRRTQTDTLVVRDLESAEKIKDPKGRGGIEVCIDGSAQSYGALRTACVLAKTYNRMLEVVTVLRSENSDVEEDNLLRQHLDVARGYARDQGLLVSASELEGDATKAILDHAERSQPWLLALGRTGIDGDGSECLGSVAERIVRRAPGNVFCSGTSVHASQLARNAA
jgi:nucleotide-binding universal stress UspA family protein